MDETRYRLFCTKPLDKKRLARCRDALLQRAYRSNYQAAIDRRALNALIGAPPSNNHGWRVTSDLIHVKWVSREQAPTELLKCLSSKCKKTHCSTNQCSCRSNDISCAELCSRTDCQNVAETLADYEFNNDCSDDDDKDNVVKT